MATVNYLYVPEQHVYLINYCNDKPYVIDGIVARARITVLSDVTTIKYDVFVSGSRGTSEFDESDVFFDKDAAFIEYETRIA
jgi:hypothetical protein